jgi:hypothetical protein
MSEPTHIGDIIRQKITPIIESLAAPCSTERAEVQDTGMTPDQLREELNLDCYTAEQADQSQFYFEELVRECTEYEPSEEDEEMLKDMVRG